MDHLPSTGAAMSDTLEVGLAAHNSRFDPDDPRWLNQVADLARQLRHESGAVRYRRTPVMGTKGTVDQMILALGSAGVFTLAVEVIRSWLGRDRNRAVEITFTDAAGNVQTVRVTAENAAKDALAPLIAAASALAKERR
jgi:hypothetical protein